MNCAGCGSPLSDGERVYQRRYGWFCAEEDDFAPDEEVGLFHSACWEVRAGPEAGGERPHARTDAVCVTSDKIEWAWKFPEKSRNCCGA